MMNAFDRLIISLVMAKEITDKLEDKSIKNSKPKCKEKKKGLKKE